jgi:hypothetical protein
MDVVSFAWSRAVSLRVGALKHTTVRVLRKLAAYRRQNQLRPQPRHRRGFILGQNLLLDGGAFHSTMG